MQKKIVLITLSDAFGETRSFRAGFDEEDKFFETQPVGRLRGETIEAAFGYMTIDGEAWRNIEDNNALEEFLRESYWGHTQVEAHLQDLANQLPGSHLPGRLLVPF